MSWIADLLGITKLINAYTGAALPARHDLRIGAGLQVIDNGYEQASEIKLLDSLYAGNLLSSNQGAKCPIVADEYLVLGLPPTSVSSAFPFTSQSRITPATSTLMVVYYWLGIGVAGSAGTLSLSISWTDMRGTVRTKALIGALSVTGTNDDSGSFVFASKPGTAVQVSGAKSGVTGAPTAASQITVMALPCALFF